MVSLQTKVIDFRAGSGSGETQTSWYRIRRRFSNGNWFDPQQMGFGNLRIWNEVFLAPGSGFDNQPRDNMEFILLPLDGQLKYSDGLGNRGVAAPGEVMVLSTGTGMFHTEFNADAHRPLNYLQIGILPHKRNLPPEFKKISFAESVLQPGFSQFLGEGSPFEGAEIRQDTRFFWGNFKSGESVRLPQCTEDTGFFLHLLKGEISLAGRNLSAGDAAGIRSPVPQEINIQKSSILLLISLPMPQNPAPLTSGIFL